MSIYRKMSRVAQTMGEYDRVRNQISNWFSERIGKTQLAQYDTQLKVLKIWFEDQIKKLSKQVINLSADKSLEKVYTSCRDYEQYLLWVQRVWEYYRNRFDQRFISEYADILTAADEVVWSCFGEVFDPPPIGIEAHKRPAPMPFIEADYSPEAFYRTPSELQSPDMSPDLQKKLTTYLRSLPVPLISLPTWCLHAPWWMVLLAHEVGHHVEREAGVAVKFRNLLITSVNGWDGDSGPGDRWKRWSNEIFADMFSVYMVGSPAYWAMAELETTDDVSMVVDRHKYPSPAIRLALMIELCDAVLKFKEQTLLPLPEPSTLLKNTPTSPKHKHFQTLANQDYLLVKPLVKQLHDAQILSFQTLKDLSHYDSELVKKTNDWKDKLTAANPGKEKTKQAARQIISGAVKAWIKINTSGGESKADKKNRQDQRQVLAKNLVATLKVSKEEGTRSGPDEPELQKQLPDTDLLDLFTQPNMEVPAKP